METTTSLQSPPVDYDHDHDDCSFIEMDPRLPPSKRFFRALSSDHFCFDLPASSDESPLGTAGAGAKSDRFDVGHVVSISRHGARVRCVPLRTCRMMSVRFFEFLLRPFLCRGRVNKNVRRVRWESSAATGSPRTSLAYSSADDNWRRSCDSESSIYEAVLHCKKTQGK